MFAHKIYFLNIKKKENNYTCTFFKFTRILIEKKGGNKLKRKKKRNKLKKMNPILMTSLGYPRAHDSNHDSWLLTLQSETFSR